MHQIKSSVKICIEDCISEPFSRVFKINDDYDYSNIRRKNGLKYYLYLYLSKFPIIDILRYLFGKFVASDNIFLFFLLNYVASKYIRILVQVHF